MLPATRLPALRGALSRWVRMADNGPDPLAHPQRLLDEGRNSEARAAARAALEGISASADPLLVGALQLVEIRAALDMGPATEELARICRDALNNVRGDMDKESQARLCQLRLGLDLGDDASSRDAHAWLNERRGRLASEVLAQLFSIEAQVAPSPAASIEHMLRGVAQLPPGPEQLELRFIVAHLQLRHGQATEPLDELVEAAVAAGEHPRVADLLKSFVQEHYGQMTTAAIEHVIEWARERAPYVSGSLLARTGRMEEAITLLTSAETTATEFVRGRCLYLLLQMLPNGQERRRIADQFEIALDRDDDPIERHNLAVFQAELAQAGRDLQLFERALVNARRAAPGLNGVGSGLIIDLIGQLILLRSEQPTSDLANLAQELEDAFSATDRKAVESVEAAAFAMTAAGPLCQTVVVGAAERLAQLAESCGAQRAKLTRARCVWIHARQRGEPGEPGDWPEGHFDDAPQWLVDLCLGRDCVVTPDELRVGHELLPRVVDARPDIADHLLATIMPVWEGATGDWVGGLETSVSDSVERPVYAHSNAWPKLHAVVEQLRTHSNRAWLHGLAATIARARGEAPPETEIPTQSASIREHLHMLFTRARQASEYVRQLRTQDCAPETERARALYREALAAAEQAGDVAMLFHIRVGYGNALRWGSNPDIEAALQQYRAAEALDVDEQQALAKLWKVWGDALYERGNDDDLREAYRLIGRSIENRTDRLRAESLLSAELVVRCHPDFDEETRLRRSIQHMLDATRAGPEIADHVVPELCRRLAELRRHAPQRHGTDSILAELQQRHPGHSSLIQQTLHGVGQSVDPEIVTHVMHMFTDPDSRIVADVRYMLSDPEQAVAQMPVHMLRRMPADRHRQLIEGSSIRNRPDQLRAELARLCNDTAAQGSTGRLVAQVFIIGQLVRLGQCDESEARQATATARRALQSHANTQNRVLLGMQLAELWQTHNHDISQPMSDIELSRELAAEAVEAAGGPEHAVSDLVVLLARGHRYARTGDRNEHLRRARDLYAKLHARALAAGDGDTAAVSLHHQVDAELEMAIGDREARLRKGIEQLESARTLAQMPVRIAEIEVSIAWYMTQLAARVSEDEQRSLLEQAMARFDAVDRSAAPSAANLDHLRSVCQGSLERVLRGPQAEADFVEAQLADPTLNAYDRAIAQHNLAIRLRRLRRVESHHILRALVLFDEAAKVREPVSARHAWETCYEAGLMLVQALRSEQGLTPELLPWERPTAVVQARSWLERAVNAAMQLGPGEELVDAAVMLGRLVFDMRDIETVTEVAEHSWDALRRAAPYLLFRDDLRGWEAQYCRAVAARLTGLALDSGIVGAGSRVRAINTEASELVIRWMLRAQASARRPTLARIQRPETATVAWWSSWQATLDRRDHRELATLLEQLHAQEPDYLTGEPRLDETWAWLEAEAEAVAIAVVLDGNQAICAVLDLDNRGARRARVLLMPTNPPPGDEAELIAHVKDAVLGDPTALHVHEHLVKWARESIVLPTLEYLGRAPKTVLWCPGPVLRLATPSSVWAGIPIACVHSLALPRYHRPKARPRSTLVAAAMKHGERLAATLEDRVKDMLDHAKRSGPARALVSAGELYGDHLQQLEPIRNTPASPEDLLAEAPNHDLIVVLAHGGAGSEDLAALECVDARGKRALLTGKHLAAHHDAFANATVVLLSCSTGRIGGELHTPDGVAGALLAAGAQAVIAPLWTVCVNVAVDTARALFDGFARWHKPWHVLARLPAQLIDPGPTLDEPTAEDRWAGRVVQLQGFVVWLG